MNSPTQVCNKCQIEKPVNDYYLQDNHRLFRICKVCIKEHYYKNNYKPKTIGAAKVLTEEQRQMIKEQLKDRKLKLKDIANSFGIIPATLSYWIKHDLL